MVEQARRIRDFDWAKTPVGPAETWPESLHVALTVCLASSAPMQLWWGPDLTLFYNDACAALLGSRHPDALGRSARDVWGDRWAKIAASVERVVAERVSVSAPDGSVMLSPLGCDGIICGLHDEAFAALAHQLRNPLVPLLTAVHAMREDGQATPQMLDMIEHQVARMSTLLQSLDWHRGAAVPDAAARKLRVLVVDDNRAAAKALQLGLGMLGCEVAIAHEASAALALAEQFAPDVAVLDLELGGDSGSELGRRLCETRPVALIAVTGHDDRERTRDAGFVSHLLKPVDLHVLHRLIVSAART